MLDDLFDDGPVSMDQLTLMKCRYIVSEVNGYHTLYCGKEVHKIPYCKEHYNICYRKISSSKGKKKPFVLPPGPGGPNKI